MNQKNIIIGVAILLATFLISYQVYRIRHRRLHEQQGIETVAHDTECGCCH